MSAEHPGMDLVRAGLADLAAGRRTEQALLVAQASTRLRDAGLDIPEDLPLEPERGLYELLAARDPEGVHITYNALRARLVSCCEGLEADAARR